MPFRHQGDRDRGCRRRARRALYKAIERYGFGGKVEETMKQDFENLANAIEDKQQLEELIKRYTNDD